MRKIWMPVIIALCCLPTVAQAAAGVMEGGPGCGLGALLWADSISKKHIMQQSFIVTTNLTGFQTFGITSGTSGCTNDGVFARNESINVFVGMHVDDLMQEMAQGSGEHLIALATLAGVPEGDRAALFLRLQARSATVISADTTPQAIIKIFSDASVDFDSMMNRAQES
jgi:hypothetical protein